MACIFTDFEVYLPPTSEIFGFRLLRQPVIWFVCTPPFASVVVNQLLMSSRFRDGLVYWMQWIELAGGWDWESYITVENT